MNSGEALSNPASWSTTDYLLSGAFATSDDVQESVFNLCDEHGEFDWLVFGHSSRTVYGSLFFAYDGAATKRVKVDLGNVSLSKWLREFGEAVASGRSDEVRRAINKIVPGTERTLILASEVDFFMINGGLSSPQYDLTLHVLSTWPGLQAVTLARSEAVQTLLTATACTSQVSLRSSDRGYGTVNRALVRMRRSGSNPDQSDYARLLTEAINCSKSQWGAVYMASGQHLLRVGVVDPKHPGWTYPKSDPSDASTAGRAFQQGATFRRDESAVVAALVDVQETPGSSATGADDSPAEDRVFGVIRPVDSSEVAIPMFNPQSGEESVGVLVLGREDRLDDYRLHQIVCARNLADRFLSLTQHEFSDRVLRVVATSKLDNRSPIKNRPRKLYRLSDEISSDLRRCIPILQETVETLEAHTHIDSASIRLVSADRRTLIRTAIAPANRTSDDHVTVSVEHGGSVAAAAFRLGVPVDLPNLDRTADLAKYGLHGVLSPKSAGRASRRSTKSEYCVPIYVDGLIAGVLNCESSRKEALSGVQGAVSAMASFAGIAIGAAVRGMEQMVLQLSARQFATSHTLLSVSDSLKQLSNPTKDDIEVQANRIVSTLTYGAADVIPSEDADMRVASTIARALQRFDGIELNRVSTRNFISDSTELLATSEVNRCLYLVLLETVRNAFLHASATDGQRTVKVTLDLTSSHAENTSRLSVDISNPLKRGRRPPPVLDLFRQPTGVRGDRLHVGAFASGVMLRSIGGDVWVNDYTADHLTIRLQVPVFTAAVKSTESTSREEFNE